MKTRREWLRFVAQERTLTEDPEYRAILQEQETALREMPESAWERKLRGLFARLRQEIELSREAASDLYDQEEEAGWNLTPQQREEAGISNWPERKSLYRRVKKMKRIRNHLRRRLYALEAA